MERSPRHVQALETAGCKALKTQQSERKQVRACMRTHLALLRDLVAVLIGRKLGGLEAMLDHVQYLIHCSCADICCNLSAQAYEFRRQLEDLMTDRDNHDEQVMLRPCNAQSAGTWRQPT